MELQFSNQVCDCLQSLVCENKSEELTQEVRLSDGMPDIGNILGAWGQVFVRSKEWREREMNITGGVTAWAMYTSEGNEQPESVEVWMPFHLRWELPQSKRDGTALVSCALRSLEARCIGARRILFRAVISIIGEGVIPSQMEVYTPCEMPKDIQLLTKKYPVRLPKEAGEKTFVIDEELSLSAEADDATKLVRCCVQPEIVDQKIMADKLVFRGAVIVDILCICQSGNIVKQSFEVPYSQFAELDREYGPGATLWMEMALTSVEPELLEDSTVRVKIGLISQYMVHDTVALEIVEDAYSTRRDVQRVNQMLDIPAVLEEKQEVIKAERLMEGNEILPLDMWMYLGQPDVYHENDGVSIELGGMFNCLGKDSKDAYTSQNATWRDSLDVPVEQGTRVYAWSVPTGKTQGVQTADGMLLKQDVLLNTRTVLKTGIPMVTALDFGEEQEQDPDRPSLILCKPGQKSLWEIAKTHGSTVEAIRQINGITEEVDGDKMLMIPVG